jgi:hypothetical protein
VTGPLAQQFAQVRDFLNTGGFGIDRTRELLAALSAIERHVQDMDLKLERIIEYRPCLRFDITPCDQRAELEEVEWCPLCVTRAALPAREKGTE